MSTVIPSSTPFFHLLLGGLEVGWGLPCLPKSLLLGHEALVCGTHKCAWETEAQKGGTTGGRPGGCWGDFPVLFLHPQKEQDIPVLFLIYGETSPVRARWALVHS